MVGVVEVRAANAANKLAKDLGILQNVSKSFGDTFYHKKKWRNARTAVGQVFSLAIQYIEDCPAEEGFYSVPKTWLTDVMNLINRWDSVDKNMEEEWTKLRADIQQLESADWYKTARASPETSGFLSTGNSKISSWKWHAIGRRSRTTTEEVAELRTRYTDYLKKDHENRVYKRRQACCEFPTMQNMQEFISFECRSETMDKIISSVYNHQSTQIYGPAGIGKTTMLVEIAKQIEKNNKFKRVVYVEVSRSPDIPRIQHEIADQLRVSLKDPTTNAIEDNTSRARKLRVEINNTGNETEQVLLVLDDVWEKLDVQEIGIPTGTKVKFLIATRMSNLSLKEDTKIPVGLLSEEDSWLFFRKAAVLDGTEDIIQIAQDVKGECFGLPLALAVIGGTLSGSGGQDLAAWTNALSYLKKSEAEKLYPPRVEEKLCKIIKYSYEHLSLEISKTIFKLCCLFPEGYDVHEEDLKRYLIGEDAAQLRSDDFESSILMLLHCHLLQRRTSKPGMVRMHAVVRDVAVYITKTEKFAFVNCGIGTPGAEPAELSEDTVTSNTRVSVIGRNINATVGFADKTKLDRAMKLFVKKADGKPDSAKVQTLLLRKNTNLSLLPNSFFEKMEGLTVLDLSYSDIKELPPSMKKMIKVRTLLLNGCKNLSEIDIIVQLRGLHVLSLRETALMSLPTGMSNLVELIVLDLSTANDLKIKEGFFTGLTKLQELFLAIKKLEVHTFIEISELRHITTLRLCVNNVLLSSGTFDKVQNIAGRSNFTIYSHSDHSLMSQKKNLHIKELHTTDRGVKFLLRETEHLIIENCFGQQGNGLNLATATGVSIFNKTKILHLMDCDRIEYLSCQGTSSSRLNELEEVQLTRLKGFMGIFQGTVPDGSFGKVREITVRSCENIEFVIPKNVLHKVHTRLQRIRVITCKKVKSIFIFEDNAGYSDLFSFLTLIELQGLLILETICTGTIPQGTFSKLKDLIVIGCAKIECVFTPELAAMLISLQKLTVENNVGLTAIVKLDANSTIDKQVFPGITHLSIQKLGNLEHFYGRELDLDLDWPLLVQLRLGGCNKLTKFPIGQGSAPYMTRIHVKSENDKNSDWYKELKNLEAAAPRFKIRVAYNFWEQGA